MRQLALMIARDGEGARRVGRVVVRGGDEPTVSAVARSVANSPLVKTALYGGDPNWGRIIQAVGAAMPGTAPLAVDIAIEGVPGVRAAAATCPTTRPRSREAVPRDEVEYEIGLPGEGAEVELLLLRPRARVRDDQRRLHDLTDHDRATSPPCSRRCPTSASSTARRS